MLTPVMNRDAQQLAADFDAVSRREFLYLGGAGILGLSLGEVSAQARAAAVAGRSVIFVMMSGGPSQLDTFDPKPEASSQVRGPSRAISTRVPGLWLSDSLPGLAERANRLALIRSLNHDCAPLHETGQQLLQCGRLVERGLRFPHFGAIVSKALPRPDHKVANAILPGPMSGKGHSYDWGQSGGCWGEDWNPEVVSEISTRSEQESTRRAYGDTSFGRKLLRARQLVEQGVRCVTVNLFDRLDRGITWDCHGDEACGPGTVYNYRDELCPDFDRAMSALIDDLEQRGLWNDTLVVATGEFGRSPRMNEQAGRDHWTECWSALVTGGGITGGAVIGASDASAAFPIDRPVAPSELTATLLGWFGLDGRQIEIGQGNRATSLLSVDPLYDLWS